MAKERFTLPPQKRMVSTAILVDGGFYKKRAHHYIGDVSPEIRAKELIAHCHRLLSYDKYEQRNLYRIFYYDCPPINKNVYNPITKKTLDLGKSDEYKWMSSFLKELMHQRKVALRMGALSDSELHYNLKYESFKKLVAGQLAVEDLSASDVALNVQQKGVDMRIGIDIASLAYKKQVNQIILVSGDSDFVPAAKQARREGIDFILNSMGAVIKGDLFEHIDGLITCEPQPYRPLDNKRKAEEQQIEEDNKDLV